MTGSVEDFDLLVVGGGKAGKTLAVDWATSGKRVAMVERGMIGGSCVNVACMPTKALVASARAIRTLQRAGQLGLAEVPRAGLELLREHKTRVVDEMVAANHKRFRDAEMELVLGEARFTAHRTVEVTLEGGGSRTLRGADTVINTGTRPLVPPIPGLVEAGALTSETLLHLEGLPESLVVIGGGPVGMEFADMFAAFGSRVSLVVPEPRLLPAEDEDIAEAVTAQLTASGVEIHTGRPVTSVERDPDGRISVLLSDGTVLPGDHVLVAVGRQPVTAELNLLKAGVRTTEAGFVVVDEHLATGVPRTWAAGDVAGSPRFTHVSLDDYRILKANLAGASLSTKHRLIPRTTFITPELARIGLTETEALAAGHDVRIATLPVAAIPRARTMLETEGIWKAVVERGTDRILGVALFGAAAGETVTTVQTAMLAHLPYTALRDMIIGHPTMTEGLNLLFAALQD